LPAAILRNYLILFDIYFSARGTARSPLTPGTFAPFWGDIPARAP
jgi:hypothetical protein